MNESTGLEQMFRRFDTRLLRFLLVGLTGVGVSTAVFWMATREAGLAALTRRVKDGFDPRGVLNAGRMWAGV